MTINTIKTFTIIALSIDTEGNVTSHTEKVITTMRGASALLKETGKHATTAYMMYNGELIARVGA